MSTFTPLLCPSATINVFIKQIAIRPDDTLGLTGDEFSDLKTVIHEAAEAQILQYINRPLLIKSELDANKHMAATLKVVTATLVQNYFIFLKQQKAGQVIQLGDMVVQMLTPDVFKKELKEKLAPYISYRNCFGAVDPRADYSQ
jgi:hypothetical protein